jgi:type II secretory pathway pseudopilin PulG
VRSTRQALRSAEGFTVAELLVTVAILGLVMAGLFGALQAGQTNYLIGSNQVDAQQNVRTVVSRMIEEIRTAGYDPTATLFPAVINPTTTGFTLQYNWNADQDADGNAIITSGATVAVPAAVGPAPRGEQITYSVSGGNLRRQETGVDGAPVVLAPVQAATFTYQDANGATTTDPDRIRTIVITVTSLPPSGGSTHTLGRVAVTMTDTVRLRNRMN